MEKQDNIYDNGNAYDFGARILDPRLGRWFSRDPMATSYPSMSPYNTFGDNPILYVDPNGMEIEGYDTETEELMTEDLNTGIDLSEDIFYIKQNTFWGISWLWNTNKTLEINEEALDRITSVGSLSFEKEMIINSMREAIEHDATLIVVYSTTQQNKIINIDLSWSGSHHNSTARINHKHKTGFSDWGSMSGLFYVADDVLKEEPTVIYYNRHKGYIFINTSNATTATYSAGNTRTTPFRPAVFIHELLDEGLYWMNDSTWPRSPSAMPPVFYQNIFYQIQNKKNPNRPFPNRDGKDHQ